MSSKDPPIYADDEEADWLKETYRDSEVKNLDEEEGDWIKEVHKKRLEQEAKET